MCIPMFIALVFTITKRRWKQLKCLLTVTHGHRSCSPHPQHHVPQLVLLDIKFIRGNYGILCTIIKLFCVVKTCPFSFLI